MPILYSIYLLSTHRMCIAWHILLRGGNDFQIIEIAHTNWECFVWYDQSSDNPNNVLFNNRYYVHPVGDNMNAKPAIWTMTTFCVCAWDVPDSFLFYFSISQLSVITCYRLIISSWKMYWHLRIRVEYNVDINLFTKQSMITVTDSSSGL